MENLTHLWVEPCPRSVPERNVVHLQPDRPEQCFCPMFILLFFCYYPSLNLQPGRPEQCFRPRFMLLMLSSNLLNIQTLHFPSLNLLHYVMNTFSIDVYKMQFKRLIYVCASRPCVFSSCLLPVDQHKLWVNFIHAELEGKTGCNSDVILCNIVLVIS